MEHLALFHVYDTYNNSYPLQSEGKSWYCFKIYCKLYKAVSFQGNQPWILVGRIDAEAETPILWPPDAKRQFIGKDPEARQDWRQK